jgi:hypothetical protein
LPARSTSSGRRPLARCGSPASPHRSPPPRRSPPSSPHLTAQRDKEWVVHAKPPFGSPEQVLKYLAGYTHRVAISDRRILAIHDDAVTFRYRDRTDGNRQRIMTLDGVEFLRRFLLHVLPTGFVRVRYFGFLANRGRA